MRFFFRFLSLTIIGLPLLAVFLALGEQADIRIVVPATAQDMRQVKARVEAFRRQHRSGERLVVTQRDLDLLIQQGLEGRSRLRVRTQLRQGQMELRFTQPLPGRPPSAYLNFGVRLKQAAEMPELLAIRLGQVELPAWLLKPLTSLGRKFWERASPNLPLAAFNDQIRMRPGRLEVDPELSAHLGQSGTQWLLGTQDQARLADYYTVLNDLAREVPPLTRQSLANVIQGLFRHARDRTGKSGDAVAENRALLTVLGIYLVGGDPAKELGFRGLIPEQPRLPKMRLVLHSRRDLAQHFGISAAIAAHAGSLLAEAAGFGKEMSDSRGGSGFSFADLAADRAGGLLGRLATADQKQARRLQLQAAELRGESDLIPDIDRLPEGLSEASLDRNLGGVDGKRFQALEREIARRLKACRVYR